MTRNEYDRRRQRLDEELRAGIELLEMAHRAQVRALDLIWRTWSEEPVDPVASPGGQAPVPRQAAPVRRGLAGVREDLAAALERLPGVFDRRDACRVLGYEPQRGALYKALGELIEDGVLALEANGYGQIPARYRKL
jgi:hypothetical protein